MRLAARFIVLSSLAWALAGCSVFDTRSARPTPTASQGGGYYKDDGPGDNPPADLAAIPDAVPRAEPPHRGASRPYTALGRDYVPMTEARGYKASGPASWYGRRYHGRPTASGEPYDMYAMTAAHPTLPIPSYVRVTNPANGRSVVVRVNDRGPFHDDRLIDLSYTAAWKLDILRGVSAVEVEYLDPGETVPARPATAEATAEAAAATAEIAPTSVPPAQPPVQATLVPTANPPMAYLQLGAFANPESADRLARQVRDKLGDSLPGVHRLEAGGLIKVQVGPYTNPLLTDLAAVTLEKETGVRPLRVLR